MFMRRFVAAGIALTAVSIFGVVAIAQTAPATVGDTSKGKALIDGKGMTLYVFDRDAAGKSTCNGQCATNWPPFSAANGAASGDFTIVTRDDGGKQWAYKTKPLYNWSKDTKPGDATGDGVNNVWPTAAP
jgi:predicted lipoprotein with Yx(FWY)xxD motif